MRESEKEGKTRKRFRAFPQGIFTRGPQGSFGSLKTKGIIDKATLLVKEGEMRFFRSKVKVTPYELGRVLSDLTYSCSDMNRLKDMLIEFVGFETAEESYLRTAHKEWFIMNMFGIVYACQETIPNGKCNAVLAAYHLHIYNRLSYLGWTYRQIDEFEILLNRRYKDYHQTLRIKNPPGPLYHLGRYAAKRMLGDGYSDNHYAIMTSFQILAATVKAAEKMIRKAYELI